MPEAYRKNQHPKGLKCHDCGKEFKQRMLMFRRLVDYTVNGVPLTHLLCSECAKQAPDSQRVQVLS